MTDYYEEKTDPSLDLVGLTQEKPFRAYLPALEGVVEIGVSTKDAQAAKEDYLEKLEDMITVLKGHRDKVISGEEQLEVF